MSTKTTLTISVILIIAGTLAGLLLWNQLPDQVASHWGANDQVNGYMPRLWGVLLMPIITIFMLALFLAIPSMDPLKANIEQFRADFNVFITLIIAFMLYIHALTLVWNIGYTNFRMSAAMLPFSCAFASFASASSCPSGPASTALESAAITLA